MQILKINEVAKMLRCSVPTIRRWLSEARRGERRFPLPLNQPGSQNLWRLEDIENWTENPAKPNHDNVPSRNPIFQAKIRHRSEDIGLKRHGIIVD